MARANGISLPEWTGAKQELPPPKAKASQGTQGVSWTAVGGDFN